MATERPAYGRLFAIKFNGVRIINLKSSDLSQSKATRDVTTKQSNDNEESRGTIASRSFSFSGLMPGNGLGSSGGAALDSAYTNGTIGMCEFTDENLSWAASGILTALNFKNPYDGNVEFDGTLKLTGVVAFGVSDLILLDPYIE